MAPQRPIDFWLRLVDRLINQRFNDTLEEHGLTRRQWEAMNLLILQPATETELDVTLAPFFTDPADGPATDDLAELVESGWLANEGEQYALTELGRTSYARLDEVVSRTNERFVTAIPDADYQTTLSVLEQMAANLGWQDRAAG